MSKNTNNIREENKRLKQVEDEMSKLSKQYGKNYELAHFFPGSSSSVINSAGSRIISPEDGSTSVAINTQPFNSNLHTYQTCSASAAIQLSEIKSQENQKKINKTSGLAFTIVNGNMGKDVSYIYKKHNYKLDAYPNFDWMKYLTTYGDLRNAGYISRAESVDHYVSYGKKEGRLYAEISPTKFAYPGTTKAFDSISNATSGLIDSKYKNTNGFSVEWYGYFIPSKSGSWSFNFSTNGREHLWIGNHAVFDYTIINANIANSKKPLSISLSKGVKYPIRIQFGVSGGSVPSFQMNITPPDSKDTKYYSDLYILTNEDNTLFQPTQVYFSLTENSATNTKIGLFNCGITTSQENSAALIDYKNEPTTDGYVKDVTYATVWQALDPTTESNKINTSNLFSFVKTGMTFGSKNIYTTSNKYSTKCTYWQYLELATKEKSGATGNTVDYELSVTEIYYKCTDKKPVWVQEKTKTLVKGTVKDSVRCRKWQLDKLNTTLNTTRWIASWDTVQTIDNTRCLITDDCRFKLGKSTEGNLVLQYAIAAGKDTAIDSATNTQFVYSKDLSRYLYSVDVPPLYNNLWYVDKNSNTIQNVPSNGTILTGTGYTSIGDFAPINTRGSTKSSSNNTCDTQCKTTGCQYYYEWKDSKGTTYCKISTDKTTSLVGSTAFNAIQPNSTIKSSKLYAKTSKFNLDKKYMNSDISQSIVKPSSYSSYTALDTNYTPLSTSTPVGILSYKPYADLKKEKDILVNGESENFQGLREGLDPIIPTLNTQVDDISKLNTKYSTTLDTINTNADKISNSIDQYNQLKQKLEDKEIYKYTADSTKDGKLMNNTPTMTQAMTEDVNQMLMQQNTTYIMGSIAAVTVLITAVIIGSNHSS
jgi:hypothetical protein